MFLPHSQINASGSQMADSRAMAQGQVGSTSGKGGSHPQNCSPGQQAAKRKPPLPSPFMAKYEGSHSKLVLYSQN